MKVNIIGMGEIGTGLYKEMNSLGIDEFIGTDISEKRVEALLMQGINASTKVQLDCDVYIISVLLSEQAIDVILSNNLPEKALVIIESTIAPGTARQIMNFRPKTKLAVFPHRYDPDTVKEHGFLKLSKEFTRVLGTSDKKTEQEVLAFYKRYLNQKFLHLTSLETAELSKPLENAYRFLEIAIAEELKMQLDRKGISFSEVRAAVNSKWNTDIKDAKKGIGRHCLPKDIRIINSFFPGNSFFGTAMATEGEYRNYLRGNGIEPDPIIGLVGENIRRSEEQQRNYLPQIIANLPIINLFARPR